MARRLHIGHASGCAVIRGADRAERDTLAAEHHGGDWSNASAAPDEPCRPDEPCHPDEASAFFGPDQAAVEALRWLTRLGQQASDRAAPRPRQDVGELSRGELRYQALVDQIPAIVFTAALDGGLHEVYVNPQITALLGYTQAEWTSNPVLWYERLHPDDRPRLDEEFARGCLTGGPFKSECRVLARDGRIVWLHGEARLVADRHGAPLFVQGVAFDITDAKRAEEVTAAALRQAEASLREKEILLKEVHHRVKNNLQITSSLLRLQEARTRDTAAMQALRASQDRIRAMALVHEMLYGARDLTRIDVREYVRTLAKQVLQSQGSASRIVLQLDLESIEMPIDVVIPCGLILNEVIANAVRHGFPDGRTGTIRIDLHDRKSNWEFVVRDDGVGLPAGFDWTRATSLGLQLVHMLTEQLGGQLDLRSERGTIVRVSLPQLQRLATASAP